MSIKTTRPVENAAKLGGQGPGYYMPKSGGVFTGEVTGTRVKANQFGYVGTLNLSSGSAADAVYLLGYSLQCRNYANTAFADIYCKDLVSAGSITATTGNVNLAGNIAMSSATPIISCTSGANWLSIQCNGGVGIRNYANTAYTVVTAGGFSNQSSVRFKDIIAAMTTEHARKILDLDLIKFRYKAEYNDDGGKIHYGIKAEQAQELDLVDLISYDHEGLPFAVDYSKLTPYLVGVVKEQDKRIKQLEAKAEKAERESTALKALLVEKGICTQEEIDGLE